MTQETKSQARSGFLILTLLAAFLAPSSAEAAVQAGVQTQAQALSQSLAGLTEKLEAQRKELHVPGMAMAIVRGDKLIYSHGFGLADLENGTPVTPETLFAIGSSTKAFTATLIGMLVDEGKMGWDDPVTKFLPYFKLKIDSDDPEARVTIRDLLSHRTGFTRMGILWALGAVSPEEVLRTATNAEPWAPFRKKFFYNNVMVMAAGLASGVAADAPWGRLLATRILDPLGMKHTNSSIGDIPSDAPLSRGYHWNEESRTYEHLPMRSLDSIAPAGAINSNVLDMAQWLRFQLGHGTFEGRVLLSAKQHAETWSPQMKIGGGVDYGLGWMLHRVAGHRVVEHGGNIDGFSAEVALFPEEDLGFVLLTNVTSTPLQNLSLKLVADALLAGEPGGTEAASSGEDLAVYAGKYEANFGSFHGAFFTVMVKGDRLAVDVPGQMVYQLEPPNDEGKRAFSLTDQIAVSFDRDSTGAVVGLKMYQSGMTFELPREGVEMKAEIELSKLQRYLGTYHSEAAHLDFVVKISHQRLAVDVPGEMLYELFPPNEKKLWVFRATDRVAVSFEESKKGVVTSLKLYRDGVQRLELLRVEGSGKASLPTVKAILALRKSPGGAAARPFRLTGTVRLVNSGVQGSVTYTSGGGRRFRSDTDLGRFGWTHEVASEAESWTDSNLQPFQKLEGKYRTQAMAAQVLQFPEDWLEFFDSVTVTGTETLGDRKAYALELRVGELPAIQATVDQETGDLLGYKMSMIDPGLGVFIGTKTRLEDFRNVDGERVAFRRISENDFSGKTIVEIDRVETGIVVEGDLFTPPKD